MGGVKAVALWGLGFSGAGRLLPGKGRPRKIRIRSEASDHTATIARIAPARVHLSSNVETGASASPFASAAARSLMSYACVSPLLLPVVRLAWLTGWSGCRSMPGHVAPLCPFVASFWWDILAYSVVSPWLSMGVLLCPVALVAKSIVHNCLGTRFDLAADRMEKPFGG